LKSSNSTRFKIVLQSNQGGGMEGLTRGPYCQKCVEGARQVQIFFDILLYFTAFGAILTLFASVVTIVIWPLKTLVSWLTAEPETELEKSKRLPLPNLDHLKRAGQ
jgi:hypothetical protein